MLNLIVDKFKDEFVGKTVKEIEIEEKSIIIYFTDNDLIRIEAVNETPVMAFTFR